jgi:hypothetical protein
MSGGLVNDAEVIAYTATTAISYAGTLVKGTTTANTVDTCGAGEEPVGYAFTDTKHPVTAVATAGVKVGVGALIPGRIIEVPVLATNAAISIGDSLETTAGGTVDKKSGAGWLVGEAMSAVGATAGAGVFVKIRVNKSYAAA